ncbi:MAG: thioesterase family protein [Clostridiales bacterium]|nr:acyl-CoA thioesterase [Eubacteriales bacterium]MDH7567446.1 thioesterase family protein [Clostridiales bacterium]
MFISETKFTVRYAETDQMGIVHHSNYPVWFEAARTGFFRKLGFPYSKIEGEGILLPLTDIKCCFKNPARYEDEIEIRVKMVELTCVRIIFSYEVYNSLDKSLIATGETAHAWTDRNLKPLNLEKRLPELYKGLKRILI